MASRDAILQAARSLNTLSYRLDPPPDIRDGTIDCSLLILEACKRAGAALPPGVRTAEQIRQATVPVAWADVKPGDLLFFEHTYEPGEAPGPDGKIASHVGLSLGAGTRRMIDAHERENGPDVGETDISTDYWQSKLIEARRLPGLAATDTAATSTEQPRGIDVASHQGAVDWQAVARSGCAFGWTKATGGAWYVNPTCAANWRGMKAAGLKRGAYHYAFESSGQPLPGPGPEAEAEHFLHTMLGLGLEAGDMLALDIEEGNGPLGEWALRWCQRVEQRTGIVPEIYTGAWFSVPHGLGDVPELARFPLWLAAYQDALPPVPAPWRAIAFHQYTDAARVPGVADPCDMSRFNGPADFLALYGKPGGAAPSPDPVYTQPGDVGSGLLAAMTADGTVPAMPSVFLPLGRSPAVVEECMALSGCIYRWHLPTGKLFKYPPAA